MTQLLHAHILGPTAPNPLQGIRVDEIVDEYERRDLVALDDQRLVDSAATIIGVPRDEVVGDRYSFVLHAPLELLARAALLPYVAPDAPREPGCASWRWRRDTKPVGRPRLIRPMPTSTRSPTPR